MTTCGTIAAQHFPQVAINHSTSAVREADAPPAGYVKIFSNLGPKNDAYDPDNGYLVEGPNNPIMTQYQWIAAPFTPKNDSVAKVIEIALVYQGAGTNAAAVAVYTTVKGLPGKILEMWNVKNLPAAGSCCTLVKVTSEKGIKLQKGTQYWVVGRTDKASSTSYDGWEDVWNDAMGPIAYIGNITNNKWTPSDDSPVVAFSVYGTD
jgi:hypothetical protein